MSLEKKIKVFDIRFRSSKKLTISPIEASISTKASPKAPLSLEFLNRAPAFSAHFGTFDALLNSKPLGGSLTGKLGVMSVLVSHVQEKWMSFIDAGLHEGLGFASVLVRQGGEVDRLLHYPVPPHQGAAHVLAVALQDAGFAPGEAHWAGTHVVGVRDAKVALEALVGRQVSAVLADAQVPFSDQSGVVPHVFQFRSHVGDRGGQAAHAVREEHPGVDPGRNRVQARQKGSPVTLMVLSNCRTICGSVTYIMEPNLEGLHRAEAA